MKEKCHIEDKLDECLDGELPSKQWRLVKKHLQTCEKCQKIWQEKQALSQKFKLFPSQSCPERVVDQVLGKTTIKTHRTTRKKGISILHTQEFTWRFAAVLATVTTIALFLVFWPLERNTPNLRESYTAEEVAKARSDVEQALRYVSDVLQLTQETFEREVMPDQIVQPIKTGLQTIFGTTDKNGG